MIILLVTMSLQRNKAELFYLQIIWMGQLSIDIDPSLMDCQINMNSNNIEDTFNYLNISIFHLMQAIIQY